MQLLTANIECICTSSCYSILARYVYKLHFNLYTCISVIFQDMIL